MKLFDKWDVSEVKVNEEALRPYIHLQELLIPRTGGKAAQGQRIWSQKTHIVERFMNKLMVPGHVKKHKHKRTSGRNTGKALNVQKIVIKVFENLEKKTGKNPIQVFVTAVENAAPREEVTSIEYGGARYSKSVEVSPLRRIDIVLRYFVWGAYAKAFNAKIKMVDALTNELLGAYNLDTASSSALSKKLELERQSDASR
jgi:small subunit ribosomal protein S7